MRNEENKDYTPGLETDNKEPALYRIIVHNDDYTPMEFVLEVLESFFYLDRRVAMTKMMEAHLKGLTVCGVYSKDIAETKITQVMAYARRKEYPFTCSMEAA